MAAEYGWVKKRTHSHAHGGDIIALINANMLNRDGFPLSIALRQEKMPPRLRAPARLRLNSTSYGDMIPIKFQRITVDFQLHLPVVV